MSHLGVALPGGISGAHSPLCLCAASCSETGHSAFSHVALSVGIERGSDLQWREKRLVTFCRLLFLVSLPMVIVL